MKIGPWTVVFLNKRRTFPDSSFEEDQPTVPSQWGRFQGVVPCVVSSASSFELSGLLDQALGSGSCHSPASPTVLALPRPRGSDCESAQPLTPIMKLGNVDWPPTYLRSGCFWGVIFLYIYKRSVTLSSEHVELRGWSSSTWEKPNRHVFLILMVLSVFGSLVCFAASGLVANAA